MRRSSLISKGVKNSQQAPEQQGGAPCDSGRLAIRTDAGQL